MTSNLRPLPFPLPAPVDPFDSIGRQLEEISTKVADLAERADTRDAAIARVEAGLGEVLAILGASRVHLADGDVR